MNARKIVVLNVVGLTPDLLRHAPGLAGLGRAGQVRPMQGVFPAVTCTAQASLLTGTLPREHGIVGNGWYFRDLAEVWLWRQSNHLVQGSQLTAEVGDLEPPRTCAKLFWWYNMYSPATWSLTPRPLYPADGRKIPDVYSEPAELSVDLQARLGRFPLFQFWGPTASIASTEWIASAANMVLSEKDPDLTLVYLPHLDYDLQRYGPDAPSIPLAVAAADREAMRVAEVALAGGRDVVVVSEYGIEAVDRAVLVNRVLREAGLLAVRDGAFGEILDAGGSRAFAVADHQVAHVYVARPAEIAAVARLLAAVPGVEQVLGEEGKREWGVDHPRSGELVLISEPGSYFAYHYWKEAARAPDFARTVDIHRKPGYDPSELFFDPDAPLLKPRLMLTLAARKLGFRNLLRAVSLRPDLARGSHGRPAARPESGPLFLSSYPEREGTVRSMLEFKQHVLRRLGGKGP